MHFFGAYLKYTSFQQNQDEELWKCKQVPYTKFLKQSILRAYFCGTSWIWSINEAYLK